MSSFASEVEKQNRSMKRNAFIIIGAGIAGLSTAIALKNIGIEATVVEASETIRPVGAGLSLAANAIEALQHLNIADEVICKGRALKSFTLFDKKGKVIKRVNAQSASATSINFTIHRACLHEVLLSKINPDQVLTGKRSVGLSESALGYRVMMEDGSSIEGNYLIIAEGIHSPLRKVLAPEARVRYAGYTCWRGITSNASLKISETSETWGREGRFGIVPLANNQIYWFACKNAIEKNSMYRDYTLSMLADNFKDYHQPVVEIINSTRPEKLIWDDICDIEPMQKFAFEKALFIGDAAHATTPNMGQGACMAIEDAVVLANCLSKESNVSKAFQNFERKRTGRTQQIVNDSWRLGKIAQLENGFFTSVRDTLFRLMPQRMYERQMELVYEVDFN